MYYFGTELRELLYANKKLTTALEECKHTILLWKVRSSLTEEQLAYVRYLEDKVWDLDNQLDWNKEKLDRAINLDDMTKFKQIELWKYVDETRDKTEQLYSQTLKKSFLSKYYRKEYETWQMQLKTEILKEHYGHPNPPRTCKESLRFMRPLI